MTYKIQYRILSLDFWGMKPRAMFNGATIFHLGRTAQIENLKTPASKVADYLAEIGSRPARSIRYQIIAIDPATGRRAHAPILFCHPFPRKAGVRLVPTGPVSLELQRDGGKRFFSDQFRLGDVTNGAVGSTQRVYQFHE